MRNNSFTTVWLAKISYSEARDYIRKVIFPLTKEKYNFLVCCQHPPTLTFGKNMCDSEIIEIKNKLELSNLKIDFLQTDRGGKATYHDENQLMLYPVCHLPSYNLGVKSYITIVLTSICNSLSEFGIKTWIDSELSGIWADSEFKIKLASVGFRFVDRISDHGVSLYLREISNVFNLFNPCGIAEPQFKSISEILGREVSSSMLINKISTSLEYRFRSIF